MQLLPGLSAVVVASIVPIVNEVFAGDTVTIWDPHTLALLATATVASAPVAVGEPANLPSGVDSVLFYGSEQLSTELFYQVLCSQHC